MGAIVNGVLLVLCCWSLALCSAATADEWRGRTIYQLLTDRFATSDGSSPNCNLKDYCGGSWQGIANKLDYISGLGFDAIWISPVLENSAGGYHGYWATKWDATANVNHYFGTPQDLRSMISDAHAKELWMMVDQVANHVGPVGNDYSQISPFNESSHYHDCSGCPSDCNINDWGNWAMIEHCRLSGLPDLDQTNQFVHDELIKSAVGVMGYGFDGMRIDTVPEVPRTFWADFAKAVGNYTVGEVYTGDLGVVASYQPPLDGVLNYPMFWAIRNVFAYKQSCKILGNTYSTIKGMFHDTGLLGTFVDNHDQTRFLNQQGDWWLYKNALLYTLMSDGIPIIYYGSEQAYSGGSDPANREPLWTSGYNTESELYQFLATTNAFRKEAQVWKYDQEERWSDDQLYAFVRGTTLVITTNVGQYGQTVTRTIPNMPWSAGTKVCNIYWPKDDCLTVNSDRSLTIGLMHGEPKVYHPI